MRVLYQTRAPVPGFGTKPGYKTDVSYTLQPSETPASANVAMPE